VLAKEGRMQKPLTWKLSEEECEEDNKEADEENYDL